MDTPALAVRGLRVALPDGRVLIDGVDLDDRAGRGRRAARRLRRRQVDVRARAVRARGVDAARLRRGRRAGRFDRGQLGSCRSEARCSITSTCAATSSRTAPWRAQEPMTPAWLERVGLDARSPSRAAGRPTLSGGQAQRVAVARVLASRRKLLFLDEPSVGLDPHRVRVLARLIARAGEGARHVGDRRHARCRARGGRRRSPVPAVARRSQARAAVRRSLAGCARDAGHTAEERGTLARRARTALVDHLEQHGDEPPPHGSARRDALRFARAPSPSRSPRRFASRHRAGARRCSS